MNRFMLCIDGLEGNDAQTPEFPGVQFAGSIRTVPPGSIPDSLGCILRLLGVQEIPEGRAALEALAVGVPLGQDDLVLRCTLCRLDAAGRILPALSEAPWEIFQKQLHLPEQWTLHPMSGYRGLLQIANEDIDGLETFAPHQYFGHQLADCMPYGGVLGQRLREFVAESQKVCSGWVILPWSPSRQVPVKSFLLRHGIQGALVCQTEIVRGIAQALQMDCPVLQHATADVDTDLQEKLQMTLAMAQTVPFVMIHVNGCDEASHRCDPEQKANFLKRIQKQLIVPLLQAMLPEDRLLICSDHRTNAHTGAHEAEPVHFWYAGGPVPGTIEVWDADAPLQMLLEQGR